MNDFDASNYRENDDECWFAQLATGEVREMTLDQLDEAFEAGVINEDTFVFREGENEWLKLRQVAGLDDEAPAPAPAPVHASAWPPVASAPAASIGPYSTAPVAFEIDDLDMPDPFRRRRRWPLALAAVAILGGVGFGATKMNVLADAAPAAAANHLAAPPAATTYVTPPPAVPVPEPKPEPTPAAAASAAPQAPSMRDARLSEETKRALAEAEKKRAAQAQAQAQARQKHRGASSSSSRPSGKPVFQKGGNPHDPLNSSL